MDEQKSGLGWVFTSWTPSWEQERERIHSKGHHCESEVGQLCVGCKEEFPGVNTMRTREKVKDLSLARQGFVTGTKSQGGTIARQRALVEVSLFSSKKKSDSTGFIIVYLCACFS